MPPKPEMCVVVRGRFEILPGAAMAALPPDKQGMLSGDRFADEDEAFTGPVLAASDFADFKPNTDLLLNGACCPPGGRPAPVCTAVFGVGDWRKSLLAIGERTLLRGNIATQPVPFTRMPITWDNAFGGPGLAANPAGCGWGAMDPGDRLPTIATDDGRNRPPELSGTPASFQPVSPFWTARRSKVGHNYGREYQRTRAPFYSDDFDWTYFNAAPPDQQLPNRLHGDEWVYFRHLNPVHADLRTRLPALRVRAIAHVGSGFVEIPLQLDTLLAEPGEMAVTLTWRGLIPVQQEDLSDVVSLLVASDPFGPFGQAPLSLERHRETLLELERVSSGNLPTFPAITEAAVGAAPAPSGPAETNPLAAVLTGLLAGKAPGVLAGLMSRLDKATRVATEAGIDMAAASASLARHLGSAQALSAATGAAPLSASIIDGLRKLSGVLDELRTGAAAGMPAVAKLLDDKRLAALFANLAVERTGAMAGDLRGRDFSGQDLSRIDFTGADMTGCRFVDARLHGTRLGQATLDGADLTGAELVNADLSEASLPGAILTGAVLTSTVLAGADMAAATFSGAKLSRCVLTSAKLGKAVFANAHLQSCGFADADLAGADFSGATLAQCDMTGAILDGLQASRSVWRRCVLQKATASGAVFTGSLLHHCMCNGLNAPSALFNQCRLDQTGFGHAALPTAVFVGSEGVRVSWAESCLDDADFRRSRFTRGLFSGAQAERANFSEASLVGCRFRKARLTSVDFTHAKLLRTDFDQTVLNGVRFDEANLFGARLYRPTGNGNSFVRTDLTRAIMVDAA